MMKPPPEERAVAERIWKTLEVFDRRYVLVIAGAVGHPPMIISDSGPANPIDVLETALMSLRAQAGDAAEPVADAARC